MKDRRDYEKAIEIVGSLIRAWDPYDLIAEGAPRDELDDEVARIVAKIPSFHSITEIAQTISDIFSASFGPSGLSPTDCFIPAQEIFMELRRAKLLPAA